MTRTMRKPGSGLEVAAKGGKALRSGAPLPDVMRTRASPMRFPAELRAYPPLVADALRRALLVERLPGITPGLRWQLAGGKRLRPAIVLWLAEALEATVAHIMPFALSVELLHNFFLVRDDIEDGDTMRRDRATLWAQFGVPIALNVADYLLARSYEQVAQVPRAAPIREYLAELLSTAFRFTVEGQGRDLAGRGDAAFSLRRYDAIVKRKTGRYLAFGWVGAAIIAGVPRREADRLWRIGEELGVVFQMRDDLLDLTAGKGRGGEVGCDIREGKPSALFALALASRDLSQKERSRLLAIMRRPRASTSPQDVAWVIELYERIGVVEACRRAAAARAARTFQEFEGLLFLPRGARDTFRQIAVFLVEREV